MIKILLLLSFGLMLTSPALAGGKGGATVVGDGGYAVVCRLSIWKSEVHFLDLYEYNIENGDAVITLGENLSVRDQVNVALQRTAGRFQLTAGELKPLQRTAQVFFGLAFDPWHDSRAGAYNNDYLNAQPVLVSPKVYDRLQKEDCHLEVAIIKPNLKDGNPVVYQNICSDGFAETEHCLLKNTPLYGRMSNGEKACLILHETLRYLPPAKAPASEREMRRVAAEICTSHL